MARRPAAGPAIRGRSPGRRLLGLLRWLPAALAVVLLAGVGVLWVQSRAPGSYPVADVGAHNGGHQTGTTAASLTSLVDDPSRPADVHVDLVARAQRVTLPGGTSFDGYTLNGTTPGPVIRARQGQLVEVKLVNQNVTDGVTLHWHGVDVPNAMDGVAGVTQDAVRPGQDFTYRFVARQAGTFWYHSHQLSHSQVQAGLFGVLILLPADASAPAADIPLLVHSYPGAARSLNGQGRELRQDVPAGRPVRVRIINTDNSPISAWTTGAPYRLVAIDGQDVNGPTPVTDQKVLVTAGARADLEVQVPAGGTVRVQVPGASLLLSAVPGGGGVTASGASATGDPTTTAGAGGAPGATPSSSSAAARESAAPTATLDPLSYGKAMGLPFDPTQANRRYRYDIGRLPGFLDGKPGFWWTINGKTGRDAPAFLVSRGDVVVISISNASGEPHPMHLHGHHAVVLSRNGKPATGSPWWVDSLNVEHGESYDVAFVADNPGIWMDHCHNLPHAAEGLMTHVVYEGVTTPFRLGSDTGNVPE